jgi:carbonic anhydrase
MSVIDEIQDENLMLASRYDARAGSLDQIPARHIAVVGCMDGRLDLPAILGLQIGDATSSATRAASPPMTSSARWSSPSASSAPGP